MTSVRTSRARDLSATTDPSETHLRGAWLVIARALSAGIVAYSLTLFVASLPLAFGQMRFVCAELCLSEQLTDAQIHSLHQLGISLDAYAAGAIAVTILTSLVWFGIAAVVFWRRSDNLVTLLLAVQLVTSGASDGANALIGSRSPLAGPASLLSVLNGALFCVFLAVFPNGRFVPRWMGWTLIPIAAASVAQLLPGAPGALDLVFPVAILALVVAQIYRYLFVSSSIQRQQAKWVILGIAASILVQLGLGIPLALVPSLSAPASLYPILTGIISTFTLTLGPIGLVFAVLRYRIYDIDLIINRTLVYGSLTVLLAAVYFGSVVGMQHLVSALAGPLASANPLIIVLSTLLIAALFTPLQRRIQSTIDHRFYRRKYDAAKTLTAFSATLRNETDLDRLRAHVLGVVEETMQPERVSLWLRRVDRWRSGPGITARS